MPDCKTCKTERKQTNSVPFIVHEADMARMERTVKRLWVLLILLVVLLVGSNVAWIIYESQFETISVDQEVDSENGSAFVAGIGDINYGEGKADNQDKTP